MRNLLLLSLALFMSACSTHRLPVEYVGTSSSKWLEPSSAQLATVNFKGVNDKRGEGIDWLGAIRGGYGNVLKSIRTQKPVAKVVEDVYTKALAARGLDKQLGGASVNLSVDVLKFDCSYYFNKEAHAHLELKLTDPLSGNVLYSETTTVSEKKGGVGAGIFGSVEALRDFAELTLATAVDKSLDAEDFHLALINANQASTKPQQVGTRSRLIELDRLKEDGLISDEEYRSKRAEILESL